MDEGRLVITLIQPEEPSFAHRRKKAGLGVSARFLMQLMCHLQGAVFEIYCYLTCSALQNQLALD